MDQRFPKARRLRKRREYLTVQGEGRKLHARHFLVMVLPRNQQDGPHDGRLGITVSKKIGNAVVRNRIKRFVRDFARRRVWMRDDLDVVVIAKRSAAASNHHELAGDLAGVWDRVTGC